MYAKAKHVNQRIAHVHANEGTKRDGKELSL